jgi:hypothetical protein
VQAGWLHPLNVRWRSLRTLCELQPLLAQGLAEPLVLLLVVYSTRHVLQAVGAGGRATEAGADRLEDNPLASAAEGMHGGDSHSTPNPNNPLALLELHETRHYDIGRKDGLHNSAPLDVISRALLTVSPLLLLLTCMVRRRCLPSHTSTNPTLDDLRPNLQLPPARLNGPMTPRLVVRKLDSAFRKRSAGEAPCWGAGLTLHTSCRKAAPLRTTFPWARRCTSQRC